MSIGGNLSKQAISNTKLYVPAIIGRQVGEHSSFIRTGSYSDLYKVPFNQIPEAAERKIRENRIFRSMLWFYERFKGKPGLAERTLELFNKPKNINDRRVHAFKPDAPERINGFLEANYKPHLEALKTLDEQVAKSWWPKFSFRYSAYKLVRGFAEQMGKDYEKFEKLIPELLASPKEIEIKVIKDLQEALHRNPAPSRNGQTRLYFEQMKTQRGKLLRDTKEALKELKAHAGDDSSAILTQLAKDSIQNGQKDTLQLLKEAGADVHVIAQEAERQGISLKRPII
jgi:predicted outer membrane protein